MSLGAHSTGRGAIFDRRTSASLLATSYPVSRLHPSAVPLSCDLDVSTKLANLREAQSSPKKVARSTNTASASFRNTCPESVKGRIVSAVILSPVKCPQTHRDRTIYLFGRGDPRLPITSNPEYLYWDQSPHRFPFETSARPPRRAFPLRPGALRTLILPITCPNGCPLLSRNTRIARYLSHVCDSN